MSWKLTTWQDNNIVHVIVPSNNIGGETLYILQKKKKRIGVTLNFSYQLFEWPTNFNLLVEYRVQKSSSHQGSK